MQQRMTAINHAEVRVELLALEERSPNIVIKTKAEEKSVQICCQFNPLGLFLM